MQLKRERSILSNSPFGRMPCTSFTAEYNCLRITPFPCDTHVSWCVDGFQLFRTQRLTFQTVTSIGTNFADQHTFLPCILPYNRRSKYTGFLYSSVQALGTPTHAEVCFCYIRRFERKARCEGTAQRAWYRDCGDEGWAEDTCQVRRETCRMVAIQRRAKSSCHGLHVHRNLQALSGGATLTTSFVQIYRFMSLDCMIERQPLGKRDI